MDVHARIRELRAAWPEPDECGLYDPFGAIRELWLALDAAGHRPGPMPALPSFGLVERLRDESPVSEFDKFRDALRLAEQAAGDPPATEPRDAGGRPEQFSLAADERLLAEWASAKAGGERAKDFEHRRGLGLGGLKAVQDRVRAKRRRRAKSDKPRD